MPPTRRVTSRSADAEPPATPSRSRRSVAPPDFEPPVTRSSTRKAARDTSPVDEEPAPVKKTPTKARATKAAATTRAATPTRKAAATTTRAKTPTRARSTSRGRRAAAAEDDSEEEAAPAKKTPTKAKAKAATTTTPRRGRARTIQDDDDDEVVEKKAAATPTRAKRSTTPKKTTTARKTATKSAQKVADEDEDEQSEAPKPTPARRRSRSRSQHRTTEEDDLLTSDTVVRRARAATPRRTLGMSALSPVSDYDIEQPLTPSYSSGRTLTSEQILHDYEVNQSGYQKLAQSQRSDEHKIHYNCKDLVFMGLSYIMTLIAFFVTVWYTNPSFPAIINKFTPVIETLSRQYQPSLLEITLFNIVVYFIAIYILSYKLRRHDRLSYRVTSMLFRGFGASNALLAYFTYFPDLSSQPGYIIQTVTPLLLAYSVVDCVYSLQSLSVPRLIELFTTIGVSSYMLFTNGIPGEVMYIFPRYLLPVFVIYFASNIILSTGYVIILSSSPVTSSPACMSFAHSLIWIHLVLTIMSPCFIFYIQVIVNIEGFIQDQARITASGLAILLSVVLAFANYADSMKVSYLLPGSSQ